MLNLFPEITVNAHCPFPCWYVYGFFSFWLSKRTSRRAKLSTKLVLKIVLGRIIWVLNSNLTLNMPVLFLIWRLQLTDLEMIALSCTCWSISSRDREKITWYHTQNDLAKSSPKYKLFCQRMVQIRRLSSHVQFYLLPKFPIAFMPQELCKLVCIPWTTGTNNAGSSTKNTLLDIGSWVGSFHCNI